jgi:hypothetical protein
MEGAAIKDHLTFWPIDRRVAAMAAIRYRGTVRHQIIPRIGSIPLRKLTAVHIEALEVEVQRAGY